DALLCWGSNLYGQLGLGDGADENVATVSPVVGGRSWARVSAGYWHTLATDDAGRLFCLGHTDKGACATSGRHRVEPPAIGRGTALLRRAHRQRVVRGERRQPRGARGDRERDVGRRERRALAELRDPGRRALLLGLELRRRDGDRRRRHLGGRADARRRGRRL